MRISCIPGLGFDHRVFERLTLGPHERRDLDWLEPERGEPLPSYAGRMAEHLPGDDEPLVLVGHSFGGVLAQEIARLRPVACVVLLGSVRSRREVPPWFRLAGRLGLQVFFRRGPALLGLGACGALFDYSRGEEQDLVRDMVGRHSNRYLRWALAGLSAWRPPDEPPSRVVQIAGSRDRTFPLRFLEHPDHVLAGAGHFFVYKRPAEVSALIVEELNRLEGRASRPRRSPAP